jgi:hypothetical protein
VVYVADRLVLQALTRTQVKDIAAGEHSMDALCRAYIHERLAYRYACVPDGRTAFEVERQARSSALGALPVLNPLHRTLRHAHRSQEPERRLRNTKGG